MITHFTSERIVLSIGIIIGCLPGSTLIAQHSLQVDPPSAIVDNMTTLPFTLTVGENGFQPDGVVQIQFPNQPQLQIVDCDNPGFFWGSTSNPDVGRCEAPDGTIDTRIAGTRIAEFTVTGNLLEGNKVYMKYRGVMR